MDKERLFFIEGKHSYYEEYYKTPVIAYTPLDAEEKARRIGCHFVSKTVCINR